MASKCFFLTSLSEGGSLNRRMVCVRVCLCKTPAHDAMQRAREKKDLLDSTPPSFLVVLISCVDHHTVLIFAQQRHKYGQQM